MLSKEAFATGMMALFGTLTHFNEPDKEVMKLWYEMLRQIPDDIFLQATKEICLNTQPPSNVVAEILAVANRLAGNTSAEEAYALIEREFDALYDPALGQASWEAIRVHLEEAGHADLVPVAARWGQEIWERRNPTATRAQFRRDYEALTKTAEHRRITAPKKIKQLSEGLVGKLKESKPTDG